MKKKFSLTLLVFYILTFSQNDKGSRFTSNLFADLNAFNNSSYSYYDQVVQQFAKKRKRMKKNLLTLLFGLLVTLTYAQENDKIATEKIWRVHFLNPGIELELPTGTYSTFSAGLGIGYGGGYPDLTSGGSGFIYIISPFLDVQEKWFYNLNKRNNKNRTIENNSGNFVSLRFITRGNSIAENVNRTSEFDFAIGPTWGIQRKYGKNFHLLFDVGPQYYFDTNGNGNIWPIMLQLNLGFDFKKK